MDYGEKKNPLNAEILAEDANQGAGLRLYGGGNRVQAVQTVGRRC